MTIADAINFIHEQRIKKGSDSVCRNWGDAALAREIEEACGENSFGWVATRGKITGICWGRRDFSQKAFLVTQVVCNDTRSLAQLMLLCKKELQGWTLQGFRRKKQILRTYNVERLTHLVQLKSL